MIRTFGKYLLIDLPITGERCRVKGVGGPVQNGNMLNESDWWDANGIVVIPGFPGSISQPNDDLPAYPATTLAFVKMMRAEGYSVRLATPENAREVTHHAADIWLPVLNIGIDLLVATGGGVFAELVARALPSKRNVKAHIKWNVQSPDGSFRSFEYDGDREGAIEAAKSFERSLESGDDDS